MKAKNFLISTSAKWFDIFFVVIFNIISVPIILSKWSIQTYAAWILLQGIIGYVNIFCNGMVDYIYSKNLQLGNKKKKEISKNITSSLPFTILIISTVILLLIIEFNYQFITNSLNISQSMKREWSMALLLYGFYSLFTYTVSPFYTTALNVFGYLPLFLWQGSLRSFMGNLLLVVAIYFYNASLVIAFSVYMISGIILHLIQSVIIYKILKKEKITFEPIDLRKGFNNFVKSTWISFSYIMDSIGTNGLRMIISLLANPASLVIFTTIRTITNMIMHGMGTIRDSFLIEVMSHISKNDTKKMNISFEFYYIFIAIIVFPFLIILQFFVEDIYNIWTLGNIQFHFKTYTILIIAVLISCIGLPFRLIVTGNNLIKTKFLTSLIKNSFLILFIIIFYKEIKILSFSIGLLLSELIELIINYFIVNNFFKKIKFSYNKKVVINMLINLSICCVIFITSSFYNISVSDYNLLVVYCVILYLLNTLLIFKRISFNTIKSVKKMLNK